MICGQVSRLTASRGVGGDESSQTALIADASGLPSNDRHVAGELQRRPCSS
jgi:hypothetical protein